MKEYNPTHTTMYRLTTLLLPVALLVGCGTQAYYIDTLTEQDPQGNYVIRWDVQPRMEGSVEIYVSSDASPYNWTPVITESITKEVTTYSPSAGNTHQSYFMMIFGGKEMRYTSTRVVPTQAPVNLRDMGGYMTQYGQQMRWGMLFRSGDLSRITPLDEHQLAQLGIKNHLSLQSSYGKPLRSQSQVPNAKFTVVEPDIYVDYNTLMQQLYSGDFTPERIAMFYNDLFNSIAFENTQQLSQVLHLLLNPSNYPILVSDELGKDRVAFLTMLVQHIAGVSRSDILADYLLSNELLPVEQLEPNGYYYPFEVQEALTEYYRSRPAELNNVLLEIEHRYGSIEHYLEALLHFDAQEQATLRQLLRYE